MSGPSNAYGRIFKLTVLIARIFIAWLIMAGPVYGVSQVRLESTATLSSGAGIVLISALQRAGG